MVSVFSWRKAYRKRLQNPKQRKLTEDDYRVILLRRQKGEALKTIAADYGVSVSHICRIARGYRRVDVDV